MVKSPVNLGVLLQDFKNTFYKETLEWNSLRWFLTSTLYTLLGDLQPQLQDVTSRISKVCPLTTGVRTHILPGWTTKYVKLQLILANLDNLDLRVRQAACVVDPGCPFTWPCWAYILATSSLRCPATTWNSLEKRSAKKSLKLLGWDLSKYPDL